MRHEWGTHEVNEKKKNVKMKKIKTYSDKTKQNIIVNFNCYKNIKLNTKGALKNVYLWFLIIRQKEK